MTGPCLFLALYFRFYYYWTNFTLMFYADDTAWAKCYNMVNKHLIRCEIMLKKVFMVIVILSLGFIGGLAYHGFPGKNQQSVIIPVQNHIGDLRFNFDFFDSVTVSQQPSQPKVVERGDSSDVPVAVKKQTASEGSEEAKTSVEDKIETPSLKSRIEQKYISRLQSLAALYEGKLNGLVGAAMAEYNTAKNANPNADINQLFNKYYSAGKSLEAECDSQVYSLLAAFESELTANSLPLDAVVKARESYESRKSSRAGQLTRVNP